MATEQELLSDLPISASLLSAFKDCGVGTEELINFTEKEFFYALSEADVKCNFGHIWKLLQDWRTRNQLKNVRFVYTEEAYNKAVYEELEVQGPEAVSNPDIASEPSAFQEQFRGGVLYSQYPESSVAPDGASSHQFVIAHLPDPLGTKKSVAEILSNHIASSSKPLCFEELNVGPSNSYTPESRANQLSPISVNTEDLDADCLVKDEVKTAESCLPEPPSFLESIAGSSNTNNVLLTTNVLKTLMLQTATGACLLDNAEAYSLSDGGQKLVVDVIARYHIAQKRKASKDVLEEYANVVTKVFKKERPDTYYARQVSGNPTGK